jgi:hypothetical protein
MAGARIPGRDDRITAASGSLGEDLAEQFGRRNAVDGELPVGLRPGHVLAIRDVAD